jgi:hypothetical protein
MALFSVCHHHPSAGMVGQKLLCCGLINRVAADAKIFLMAATGVCFGYYNIVVFAIVYNGLAQSIFVCFNFSDSDFYCLQEEFKPLRGNQGILFVYIDIYNIYRIFIISWPFPTTRCKNTIANIHTSCDKRDLFD